MATLRTLSVSGRQLSRPLCRAFSTTPVARAPASPSDKPRRTLSFITKSGQSQFKTFLPVTPSLRQLRQPVSPHLHKGGPLRALTVAKRGTGGRNDHGRITTRARGGGHKRRIRNVDFFRTEGGRQEVVRIEYDPGRSAHIALVRHAETGNLSYILAPDGLRQGDEVWSFRSGVPEALGGKKETLEEVVEPWAPQTVLPPSSALLLPGQRPSPESPPSAAMPRPEKPTIDLGILRSLALKPGNCLPLHLLPLGTLIHGISLSPSGPLTLSRSAGASARIISHTEKHAMIRLGSGEVRLVGRECVACVGAVGNADWGNRNLGKAGRMRWLGFRPQSRGVAMNATDHPHGGGRGKSKGNTDPVDPWGNSAKGGRTRPPNSKTGNKMVVKERPRGTEKGQKGR